MRPRIRLRVHRLLRGPLDRPLEEERQGRVREDQLGPGLLRDRREGQVHHRLRRPRGPGHGPGPAPVRLLLHQALHAGARQRQRLHARRGLQHVQERGLHAGHRRGRLPGRRRERQGLHVHRPQLRRRHPPEPAARPREGAREGRVHRAGRPAPEQLHRLRRRVAAHQPGHRPGAGAGHEPRAREPRPVRQEVRGRAVHRLRRVGRHPGPVHARVGRRHHRPEGARHRARRREVRRVRPGRLHRAELARRLRLQLRQLRRDRPRRGLLQRPSWLLEPEGRRPVRRVGQGRRRGQGQVPVRAQGRGEDRGPVRVPAVPVRHGRQRLRRAACPRRQDEGHVLLQLQHGGGLFQPGLP